MTEFKEDWKFDKTTKLINPEPNVSYHAHVKNLRNTVLAHARKAMVSPKVRLVEHKSNKMEKMKIFTTPLHTATSSKHPYGKLKTGREDPELEALLAKVSPECRHLKMISDLDYYRDIFVPKLEKKPLKTVKDHNLALTLSCRRKIAIPTLTGQNFTAEIPKH